MNEQILEALRQLDGMDDSHWTGDGAPKVDVVKNLSGLESLTRQNIIDAAPQFSRENMELEGGDDAETETGTEEVAADERITIVDLFLADEELTPNSVIQMLAQYSTKEDAGILNEMVEFMAEKQMETERQVEAMIKHRNDVNIIKMMVQSHRDAVKPPQTHEEANRAYLDKQAEIRAARHAGLAALPVGVRALAMGGKQTLDQQLAAQNTAAKKAAQRAARQG